MTPASGCMVVRFESRASGEPCRRCPVRRRMTGGEIVVNGAGADAAARARRGLIAVGGDVGADAARAIIAGTLVVFGRTGPEPGRGSKRGSIVALGPIDIPSTYETPARINRPTCGCC